MAVRSSERTCVNSLSPSAPAPGRLTITRSSALRRGERARLGIGLHRPNATWPVPRPRARLAPDPPREGSAHAPGPLPAAASGAQPHLRAVRDSVASHRLIILRRARFLTRVTSAISSTGLGKKVVRTGVEPLDLIRGLVERGHHDDGHVRSRRILLDAPAYLEPVHARHHDVKQHDVDPLARAYLERFRSAVGRQDLEILRSEACLEQLRHWRERHRRRARGRSLRTSDTLTSRSSKLRR